MIKHRPEIRPNVQLGVFKTEVRKLSTTGKREYAVVIYKTTYLWREKNYLKKRVNMYLYQKYLLNVLNKLLNQKGLQNKTFLSSFVDGMFVRGPCCYRWQCRRC